MSEFFFDSDPFIPDLKTIYSQTHQTLKKYALSPRKSWQIKSQHFMVDPNILHAYVQILNKYKLNHILEIGPGLGTLTSLISQGTVQKITLVEKDANFAIFLERSFPQASVINTDILTLPTEIWESVDAVIGNIPYEISSPLIFKIIKTKFFPSMKLIAFLFQKEFAERLCACAGTKSYSRLSVNVQIIGVPHLIAHFGPGSFFPPPKVASSLVEIIPFNSPVEVVFMPEFQDFVTRLFARKNRQVRAVLQPLIKHKENRAELDKIIRSDDLALSRVIDISPNDIISLFKRLQSTLYHT